MLSPTLISLPIQSLMHWSCSPDGGTLLIGRSSRVSLESTPMHANSSPFDRANAIETTILLSEPLLLTALVIGLVVRGIHAGRDADQRATLSLSEAALGIFAAPDRRGAVDGPMFVDLHERLFASIRT